MTAPAPDRAPDEAMRKAFEEWMGHAMTNYAPMWVEALWDAWQQGARSQSAALADARAEVERLKAALDNPYLTGVNIGNGSIDIGLEGAGPLLVAGMFTGLLDKGHAPNYVEVTIDSNDHGPLLVHVQKLDGKTPHTLRAEAEAALAAKERECEERLRQLTIKDEKIEQLRLDRDWRGQEMHRLHTELNEARKAIATLRLG